MKSLANGFNITATLYITKFWTEVLYKSPEDVKVIVNVDAPLSS
jgi:hypothetical protein